MQQRGQELNSLPSWRAGLAADTQAARPTGLAVGVMHTLLSHLGQALFVTDRQGSVLHTNDSGERLLRERDALCLCAGQLSTPCTEQRSRLAAFIGRRGLAEPGSEPESLTLAGRSGRFLTLRALPAELWPTLTADAPGGLMLVARDPHTLGPLARQRARAAKPVLGWTERETELVEQLLSGRTLAEAALAMNISEGHGRQRLKVIFAKAGVGSQAQLIARLAELV